MCHSFEQEQFSCCCLGSNPIGSSSRRIPNKSYLQALLFAASSLDLLATMLRKALQNGNHGPSTLKVLAPRTLSREAGTGRRPSPARREEGACPEWRVFDWCGESLELFMDTAGLIGVRFIAKSSSPCFSNHHEYPVALPRESASPFEQVGRRK